MYSWIVMCARPARGTGRRDPPAPGADSDPVPSAPEGAPCNATDPGPGNHPARSKPMKLAAEQTVTGYSYYLVYGSRMW
jgi:hypothetical protein